MPERMCVSCGSRMEKTKLIRITNSMFPDPSMNSKGRGAYICRSSVCVKKLITSKNRLSLSLKNHPTREDMQKLSSQLMTKVINGQD